MNLRAVLLTFVLAAVGPIAYGQTTIRQVDFLNFTLPLPWCSKAFKGDIPAKLALRKGYFKHGNAYVKVERKNILYSDLTGDSVEEAIVPVLCSPMEGNYAGYDEVLVFTLQNGKPGLLGELDEDVFENDFKRFYNSTYLNAESKVRVSGNKLIINKTSGECHVCSDTYRNVVLSYQWNGRGFSLVGKLTMTKVKQGG